MRKSVVDIAKEIEKEALQKGYERITPEPDSVRIWTGGENLTRSFEFSLWKDGKVQGRARVMVKDPDVQTQTGEPTGPIEIYDWPHLVNLKMFARILNWNMAKLKHKLNEQWSGRRAKPPLPDPVDFWGTTPIWTVEQAWEYRERLEWYKKEKGL